MAKQIDTVTVEVVRNLLMSIAEETYGIIVRSSRRQEERENENFGNRKRIPGGIGCYCYG